jgi:hypothetical protein
MASTEREDKRKAEGAKTDFLFVFLTKHNKKNNCTWILKM